MNSRSKIDALVVHDDEVLIGNAKAIATFAAQQKLHTRGKVGISFGLR
jgi:hypothetical protein